MIYCQFFFLRVCQTTRCVTLRESNHTKMCQKIHGNIHCTFFPILLSTTSVLHQYYISTTSVLNTVLTLLSNTPVLTQYLTLYLHSSVLHQYWLGTKHCVFPPTLLPNPATLCYRPSAEPSQLPTEEPTQPTHPTYGPNAPTRRPTQLPTMEPTHEPSAEPTIEPTR